MKTLRNKILSLINHNDEKIEASLLDNIAIWLVYFNIDKQDIQICINGFLLLEYEAENDIFKIGGYKETCLRISNGETGIEFAKYLIDFVDTNFEELHKIIKRYYNSLIKG